MFRRPPRATAPLVLMPGGRSVQNRLAATVPRFQREHLLAVAAQSLEVGLAAGRLSEASLRVSGNKMLVTGRSAWFGSVTDSDLLLAAMQPNKTLDTPDLPQHIDWHRALYAAQPTLKVVLVMQPITLMQMSLRALSTPVDDRMYEMPATTSDAATVFSADFGGMAIVPNATSAALAAASVQAGVLLTASGVVSYGAEGYEAIAKLHSAERWAAITMKSWMKSLTD